MTMPALQREEQSERWFRVHYRTWVAGGKMIWTWVEVQAVSSDHAIQVARGCAPLTSDLRDVRVEPAPKWEQRWPT